MVRADSKGAPFNPRPKAGKEPAGHARRRGKRKFRQKKVSVKAWWAEFQDRDGSHGLGLSGRDKGQQGAEERRQSRPHRALGVSAQRPAVRGATRGHEAGG